MIYVQSYEEMSGNVTCLIYSLDCKKFLQKVYLFSHRFLAKCLLGNMTSQYSFCKMFLQEILQSKHPLT